MRSFFLVFVLAWLSGLLIHTLTQDIRWLILFQGAVALALLWRQAPAPLIAAACCLVVLGYARTIIDHDFKVVSDCRPQLTEGSQGTVTRVLKGSPDSQRFIVTLPSDCSVLIHMSPFPAFVTGDVVIIQGGKIQTIGELRARAEGYAQYVERQGVNATIDWPRITLQERTTSWPQALMNRLQRNINQTFTEPEAGVVNAMLLAYESNMPEDVIARFQHTGVSHILAISGSNISLLAIMIIAIIWLLPLPPLVATLIVAGSMWAYIMLIGMPTSALRAVIFWTLALLAYQGRRLTNLVSIIFLAVLVMISVNPLILQDVGWQLSVAAVAGIGLILFLVPRWPAMPLLAVVTQSLAITLGATIVTWPIIAYHFHTLSLIGLFTNVFIVPLAGMLMMSALIAIAISFVVPGAALMASFFVHIIWRVMDVIIRLADAIPFGYFENVAWPKTAVFGYYLLLIGASIWCLRWQKRSWREVWA